MTENALGWCAPSVGGTDPSVRPVRRFSWHRCRFDDLGMLRIPPRYRALRCGVSRLAPTKVTLACVSYVSSLLSGRIHDGRCSFFINGPTLSCFPRSLRVGTASTAEIRAWGWSTLTYLHWPTDNVLEVAETPRSPKHCRKWTYVKIAEILNSRKAKK